MILRSKQVLEGAGVKLNRVFANHPDLDPFLLLDHFKSKNPDDYMKGFPWHPHRGIETVTYMISGEIDHEDSTGSKGRIKEGQVQWMTAGSGIFHQEMPKEKEGTFEGFQLWINLKDKMAPPKYRGIDALPEIKEKNNVIRVLSGNYKGTQGPVKDRDITYFDVEVHGAFATSISRGFAYVFEGRGTIGGEPVKEGELLTLENKVRAEGDFRFLLIAGEPLNIPVAWYGPIVMTTQKELQEAMDDLKKGTFVK